MNNSMYHIQCDEYLVELFVEFSINDNLERIENLQAPSVEYKTGHTGTSCDSLMLSQPSVINE